MIEPFANPNLAAPTPLTVEDDTVFGHVADWSTPHIGFLGQKVTPPHSLSGYRFFHLGAYQHRGEDISVGTITLHALHATNRLSDEETRRHYESTGSVAAYIRCGEDAHGIWFSGKIALALGEADREALRGAKVSGDWRDINGHLEMVGVLAVNTPGFPIPRPSVRVEASSGRVLALTASGIVIEPHFAETRTRLRLANTRRRLRALR